MFRYLLFALLTTVIAQRWNPDFTKIENGDYYKQLYDSFMREIDQNYKTQKDYMMQQPGYAEYDRQRRQQLMETYAQNNPRMDEFGNLVAGDPNAPTYLTCNGQGCVARG